MDPRAAIMFMGITVTGSIGLALSMAWLAFWGLRHRDILPTSVRGMLWGRILICLLCMLCLILLIRFVGNSGWVLLTPLMFMALIAMNMTAYYKAKLFLP